MRLPRPAYLVMLMLTAVAPAFAQHVESLGQTVPEEVLRHLNTETAEISDLDDAKAILEATLFPQGKNGDVVLSDPDVYCVIHVMRWSVEKNNGDEKYQPGKQNWYIYHSGKWSEDDFKSRNRVFGVKRLWLMYIHLNRPGSAYTSRYQFAVKEKTPAWLANLAGLASMFFPKGDAAGSPTNFWGGGDVIIRSVPSDITIQPIRINSSPSTNVYEKLGDPKTIDNEGKYRLDFTIGVPIKAAKELTVDADAATAAPKKIDKQNLFALINWFPQPVDIKSSGLRRWPHLVAGVAISDKPVDKIILAGGWGPAFANFYLGVMLVRQPDNDGNDKHYERQVAFGVNLSYRGAKQALDAQSKK